MQLNILRSVIPALGMLVTFSLQMPIVHAQPDASPRAKLAMKHEEGFIARKAIEDDYTVVFHVMRAPEGMRYSRNQYHLMVVVEKDGKPVPNLHLTSHVKHPDGTVEEKRMSVVGNWHMAIYDLSHEQGRHWMTVSFTKDGKTYSAGAYYPEWDFSGHGPAHGLPDTSNIHEGGTP